MINNTSLRLKDVKITDFKETGGKLEVFLEKEASSAIWPNCHTLSTSIKDHKYCWIIGKPIESIPIQLVIKKRRFFCNNPYCSKKSFTEEISGLPKKFSFEGKINKIRLIQRKVYHYRNFSSLRYQILKSES